MKILNYTPHEVTLMNDKGEPLILQSAGVARVAQESTVVEIAGGFRLVKSTFGEVTGLPEKEEGTMIIVSAFVRLACPDRTDLGSPAEIIRNAKGCIVACGALEINQPQ